MDFLFLNTINIRPGKFAKAIYENIYRLLKTFTCNLNATVNIIKNITF